MKRLKLLCSVITAAAVLLAATSCDLELRDSLGEAGTSYTETGIILDAESKYVVKDVVAENSNFTFAANQLTAQTGVSVSFNMKDDFQGGWDYNVFKSKQVIIFLGEIGSYKNGTWNGNFWVADYCKASNGGAYNSWQKNANFATVSFNADGTITMYRNGVLMLTYAADGTSSDAGAAKISEVVSQFIADLTTSGITTSQTMKNLVITKAVDDTGAEALYNTYKN